LVVTVTLRPPVEAFDAMVKVAVIWVALTTVTLLTLTPVPLMAMVAPALKLEPVRVTGTAVLWLPVLGLTDVSTGEGGGGGLTTVRVAVPTAEGESTL